MEVMEEVKVEEAKEVDLEVDLVLIAVAVVVEIEEEVLQIVEMVKKEVVLGNHLIKEEKVVFKIS